MDNVWLFTDSLELQCTSVLNSQSMRIIQSNTSIYC